MLFQVLHRAVSPLLLISLLLLLLPVWSLLCCSHAAVNAAGSPNQIGFGPNLEIPWQFGFGPNLVAEACQLVLGFRLAHAQQSANVPVDDVHAAVLSR